jgi:hypothetical protein
MVQQARHVNLVDIQTELSLCLGWGFLGLSTGTRLSILVANDDGKRLPWLYLHFVGRVAADLNIFPVKVLLVAVIRRLEGGLNRLRCIGGHCNRLLIRLCAARYFGSQRYTPSLWRAWSRRC